MLCFDIFIHFTRVESGAIGGNTPSFYGFWGWFRGYFMGAFGWLHKVLAFFRNCDFRNQLWQKLVEICNLPRFSNKTILFQGLFEAERGVCAVKFAFCNHWRFQKVFLRVLGGYRGNLCANCTILPPFLLFDKAKICAYNTKGFRKGDFP